MGFKLPKLTTDIDCGPIGYPGLVVTCWLNPGYEGEWTPPEDGGEWDTLFYHGLGRIVEQITVPPEFTDTGAAEVHEIADSRAMHALMNAHGFDQQIVLWAVDQYQRERQERMDAAAKN